MENNLENEEIAKVGDIIEFIPPWSSDPMQGSVTAVHQNSVVVQLEHPKKTDEMMYKNTVVNHKKYQIISQA